MISPASPHLSPSGVLPLQEIASNTSAKEKVPSYLSRPTVSELVKADDTLSRVPTDLLADATFTQAKNISLAHMDLYKNITNLVECSDATKVVMSSTCGKLIGIDVVTEKIHKKILLFDSLDCIEASNEGSLDESTDTESFFENNISAQSAIMSDSILSGDDDRIKMDDGSDDNTGSLEVFDHQFVASYDAPNYVGMSLSPDGSVWGAISPEHKDRLLIGEVANLFDSEVGDSVQACDQISMAEKLGTYDGTLSKLALRSNGLQCAAVWESFSTIFNGTHKLLFCQTDSSVQETSEMPRVYTLAHAHVEPLLAVSHENGYVSLWSTQQVEQLPAIKFFESDELITAMDFSRDDKILYIASVMGKLCAFDRISKQNNQRHVSDGVIEIIRSHPQGLCVVTAADDGNVILWNKDITKKLATFTYNATALNFSHDGTFLYVVTQDKQFHRIPLGNPWELICLRAGIACKDKLDLDELFNDWVIYKEVFEKGEVCSDVYEEAFKKNLGVYKELYKKFFINCSIYKRVMSQEEKERGLLGEPLREYLKQVQN